MQSISVFIDITNVFGLVEKMLMSIELKGCVTLFIFIFYLV